jgi:hypothetical protein
LNQIGLFEYSVHTRRAGSDHVVVKHHVSQAAIPFAPAIPDLGMVFMIIGLDRLAFGLGEPVCLRYESIVPIRRSLSIPPRMVGALRNRKGAEQLPLGKARTLTPILNKCYYFIALVGGNPPFV